ncbi:MAG: HEPN domain-containing protein [Anaerolineae bacterium]
MLSHRDIARALLIEAYADLEAARVLRQAGVYARCMAHCQHAVEKALKAALAVRDVIITDRHEVSEDFRQTYADWCIT